VVLVCTPGKLGPRALNLAGAKTGSGVVVQELEGVAAGTAGGGGGWEWCMGAGSGAKGAQAAESLGSLSAVMHVLAV
jgi:hypothetical protein